MVHWINIHWNNSFVNPLCCVKTWSLTPSAISYGKQAHKIQVDYSSMNMFKLIFPQKLILKSRSHSFSCRSPLLSTTVLSDRVIFV